MLKPVAQNQYSSSMFPPTMFQKTFIYVFSSVSCSSNKIFYFFWAQMHSLYWHWIFFSTYVKQEKMAVVGPSSRLLLRTVPRRPFFPVILLGTYLNKYPNGWGPENHIITTYTCYSELWLTQPHKVSAISLEHWIHCTIF